MTKEVIRASEEELLVFISSRQDEEVGRARELAVEAVNNYPGVRVWAFEDAPASSEAARERYIRNAGKADFVIWLIGSTTTPPIVEEVDACLAAEGKLLAFKLPSQVRDAQTQQLIEKVRRIVTWREVEKVETLPEHIKAALNDEIARALRDPSPKNHDLYLEQKLRESVAETKRLWTTFGVQDDVARELAEEQSIGNVLVLPAAGVLQVMAVQGSGKTLAAHRLYQRAIANRLKNRLQPLPVFLNARTISGELNAFIEKAIGDQVSAKTQRVLVIIDGLDEVGRHEANQILGSVETYTEATLNSAAVVMTRPLPGLKSLGESIALPACSDEEFLSIASIVAGRNVGVGEIPHRLFETRIPLFAVIVGTHFRNTRHPLGTTPSQMVNQLVQRILQESADYPEDKAEPLKKLAIACINSGKNVEKAEIDPRTSVHAHLVNSRLIFEEDGKFDFSLAIFREWFAGRAIVEGMASPADIDLNSDRWVVPLAIAINSGNAILGSQIMETISAEDPGIAGLLLEEVKHNWSAIEHPQNLPDGTAIEIGHQIRRAMFNWQEGLGTLMTELGPTSRDGDILSLAVRKEPPMVTTCWYQGQEGIDPIVELPPEWAKLNWQGTLDLHSLCSKGIEATRVWPWTTTLEDLSSSLADLMRTYRLALGSNIGTLEFAADFSETMGTPTIDELADCIDQWTKHGRMDSIHIGQYTYTFNELELIRATLPDLPLNEDGTIADLWPGQDKPWPEGRTVVWWFERYTDKQLLKRTMAIFDGAMRIYNDIVEQWLPAFNKRHQMNYILPLRLEGVLNLRDTSSQRDLSDATLIWWPRLVNSNNESGVSFELNSENEALGAGTREKLQVARNEFTLHRGSFRYTSQLLPGNDSRPATKLAHDWLAQDLKDLRWL